MSNFFLIFAENLKYMERIKKFNIFGTTFRVLWVDVIPSTEEEGFIYGQHDGVAKTLKIALKDRDGKTDLPETEIELAFYRELVHAILGEGAYGYTKDEPMVEWVAKCIRSLKQQKVI